jgi:hypothetical protein
MGGERAWLAFGEDELEESGNCVLACCDPSSNNYQKLSGGWELHWSGLWVGRAEMCGNCVD